MGSIISHVTYMCVFYSEFYRLCNEAIRDSNYTSNPKGHTGLCVRHTEAEAPTWSGVNRPEHKAIKILKNIRTVK